MPAVAQSGVLLGLEHGGRYRTLWLAADGDSVALLAGGPDLLVPRADGFWRVGVVELDGRTRRLAVDRVSRWPALVDSMRAAHGEPVEDECQPSEGVELLFVGSNHVATRESRWESELCSLSGRAHGGDGYHVYTFDADTPALERMLDSTALAEGLRVAPDSARRAADLENPDATAEERALWDDCGDLPTWYVHRGAGRWEIEIEIPGADPEDWLSDVCDGHAFALPAALPREVVGHDALFPDLRETSLVVPNVRDAVSSPRGDLIVALTDDSLYAARVLGGRIRQPALALPIGGRVVMAQWALGRNVRRWTEEVGAWLGERRGGAGVSRPAAGPYGASVTGRILTVDRTGTRRESGNTVLVGQPTVVGFDGLAGDTTLSVDEVRIDGRWFDVMPDTARSGVRLDVLLNSSFVAFGAGRSVVTASLGPPRAWSRMPFRHEFVAIDYAEGNEAAILGRPPEVTFSVPDGAEGVPVEYLPRLDFSEPVRNVAGRVMLWAGAGNSVPFRLAGVGTSPDGTPRLYPNLRVAGADVAVRSVTLIPAEPLAYDTGYRVSLGPGVLDTDTTATGAPDPQPLGAARDFDFRTYRPRATEPGPVATEVATGTLARAYLARTDEDGETRIGVVSTGDLGRPDTLERPLDEPFTFRIPGRLRGLTVAEPELSGPHLVAGMEDADGSAGLVVVAEYSDSLRVAGLVPLPQRTRIAALTSVGPNVYVASEQGAVHVVGVEGARRERGRPPADGTVAGTIPAPTPSTRVADVAAGELVLDGVPRTLVVTVGASPVLAVSDPEALRTVGVLDSLADFGEGRAVALGTVSGRPVAVVVGAGSSGERSVLAMVDLTDPRAPAPAWTTPVGSSLRDVLVRGSLALVSTDTRTEVARLGMGGPTWVGGIDDFGGRLTWADGGDAILATTGAPGRAGLRGALLAPVAKVHLWPIPYFVGVDSAGRFGEPLEAGYRISDPPPIGDPYLVVVENDKLLYEIPVTDVSPGTHSVQLPADLAFRGPFDEHGLYATLDGPDGSAVDAFGLPPLGRLERGPDRRRRPSAPSTWDLHEPRPPPLPRIDSISPSVTTAGVPVTVTVYGTDLDSVRVEGWGPVPVEPGEEPLGVYEPRVPGSFGLTPVPGGGTFTLSDTVMATPALLFVKTTWDDPGFPLLVADPALPRMGTADPVLDPTVRFEWDRWVGWSFSIEARATPGDRYVLGRDSTPGFVLGVLPDPVLGPDGFVVAALTPDGRGLSPPVPIGSIPVESVDDGSHDDPAEDAEDAVCSDLLMRLSDLDAHPVHVESVSLIGSRTLELTGIGLTEDMPVTFHVGRPYNRGGVTAPGRLTHVETLPADADWQACGLSAPPPSLKRARLVYAMEPHLMYVYVVWRPRGGTRGR